MRIYIDESGSFVVPQVPTPSWSLVLSLIVPSAIEADLFFQFLRLRDGWPQQKIEIKGSSLNEKQAAEVIDLLSGFDVLVDFVALDMSTHSDEIVGDFKRRQAEEMTAHITRDHHPGPILHLVQLENSLRKMPNQLFLQTHAITELILKAVRTGPLYFSQRRPEELGDIAWTVDRKDRVPTEMEETWTTTILPFAESRFARQPIAQLIEGDYSHFARYEINPATDSEMARHLDWMQSTYGDIKWHGGERVVDAKRLLTEQLTFEDSRNSLGLQLADMLASTLRRGINNRLQRPGWENLGKLVVRATDPGWFIQLGHGEPRLLGGTAVGVYRALGKNAKSMLLGLK